MKNQKLANQAHIPSATYRLQFNNQFTFKMADLLLDYLHELGITDCYASPLFRAKPGSLHGYDVTDHKMLNPELGTEEEFALFARHLGQRQMGLLMDVVPNHMCIAASDNRWWNDTLENGPSSPYATCFDIDWQPPKSDLFNKVLLPVLGDQYGRVLENQEIIVAYQHGAFFADYYDTRLPIAPRTYSQILEPMLPEIKSKVGDSHPHVLELESIITALGHLPLSSETDQEKIREQQREKEIIKRRLDTIIADCEHARRALDHSLDDLNGTRGVPQSFDRLERLLSEQAYRLCFWGVAADEINYRRFFDINELAAIRVEVRQVFAAVHELILRLIKEGVVTGLRIDHVDGLFDPVQYLNDLQAACLETLVQPTAVAAAAVGDHSLPPRVADAGSTFYVVVEKILSHGELMRSDWPVHGTTGYGFLNQLNGVFVETANESGLRQIYERITGKAPNFADLVYRCKKIILRVAMSSELQVLARRLDRISEQHRFSRDFTLNSLEYALGEVIACFPVYRSYTRQQQDEVSAEDRRHILIAIGEAKRRNPSTSPSIFDFIGKLLLLEDPDGITKEQRDERRDFILRFQQLTGPVMAKGFEDTAFYRYYPMASLNEVGGDPQRFGITVEEFHNLNRQRLFERPHGLSATATHDTKRSEDVRARINVLSEIPGKWYRAVSRWGNYNLAKKTLLDGVEVPNANEEYLLYQTLLGAWPIERMSTEARAEFVSRIQQYLVKAMREAKVHTSWINPNEAYENAIRNFIEEILKPEKTNRFLKAFSEFHAPIARAGIFNSLAQTLLKITAPGVPDFYQGTELWDFSLVDPDNRRPVDYALRRKLLASFPQDDQIDLATFVLQLLAHPRDGRIKLYVTSRALRFRRNRQDLFAKGTYLPLASHGQRENHVLSFARTLGDQNVLILAGRFFTRLGDAKQLPIGKEAWGDTVVTLHHAFAAGWYRNIFTGERVHAEQKGNEIELSLAQAFAHLPVALLEQVI